MCQGQPAIRTELLDVTFVTADCEACLLLRVTVASFRIRISQKKKEFSHTSGVLEPLTCSY